jgi:hypothetical protein
MATDHGAFVSGLTIMPTAPSKSEWLALGGDKGEAIPLLGPEFGVSVSQHLLRALMIRVALCITFRNAPKSVWSSRF